MNCIKKGESPVRSEDIEHALRYRIVNGRFKPGGRLPTRHELQAEFRCSPVTLQRAIDRLARQGFIESSGSAGTFVKEDAPHLTRFGLVLPHRPTPSARWSVFWTALCRVAQQIERETDLALPVFYDAPSPRQDADYQELLQSVVQDRLSGLIFLTLPFPFQGTPVLAKKGIPRVAVAVPLEPFRSQMPFIYVDFPAFISRALDFLARDGRRRVALISSAFEEEFEDDFCAGAARRRLETRPYWIQPLSVDSPRGAMRTVQLLFTLPAKDRPDAVIVADDNLVQAATAGIAAAGVKAPQDLRIVAHCNYPVLPKPAVPVTRLGFSARAILERCIEDLRKQRAGQKVPEYWQAPAVFEKEMKALKGAPVAAAR
jgi:DNA-binding LacI/PurR family transcriptional regulator